MSQTRRTRPTRSSAHAHYRSASVLKNRRVVLNIKGNDYLLVVAIACRLQIVQRNAEESSDVARQGGRDR